MSGPHGQDERRSSEGYDEFVPVRLSFTDPPSGDEELSLWAV